MKHPAQLLLLSLLALSASAKDQPNILFIAVDDLRPELNCYGRNHIHSPNIDRLAATGMLFERAYCMVPTCGASRAALMTGIRPAPKRFVTYFTRADHDAPKALPLNTHLKQSGYHAVSLGKIYHVADDHAAGWSEKPWRSGGMTWQLPENKAAHERNRKSRGKPDRGPPFESADRPDSAYPDGQLATRAIRAMTRLSEKKKPFFLAVGFLKPHLPFNAPKKYWDLYQREKIQLPGNYHPPKNAPAVSIHSSGELRAYDGVPRQGKVSDDMARSLIHGYYACVSFTDAQVGRILGELDRLGLAENTIVALWGDHGWNLGEHTLWCKHSTYETSMHAPLIIRAPGMAPGRSPAIVEFIDLYPTLSALAGTPAPDHLEGRSLVPLMKDPGMPWENIAVGRFGNSDTIRTERWRFSEYSGKGNPLPRMLYDHQVDPQENQNVSETETLAETVSRLESRLRASKGK